MRQPGRFPWRYDAAQRVVFDAKRQPIAMMLDNYADNGALISAAPDLEAALRELLDEFVRIAGRDCFLYAPAAIGAKAALAQARAEFSAEEAS